MTQSVTNSRPTPLHHEGTKPPAAGEGAAKLQPPHYSQGTLKAYASNIVLGTLGGVTLPAIYARHYFDGGYRPAAGRALDVAKGFVQDLRDTWSSEGLSPAVQQAAYALPTSGYALLSNLGEAALFGIKAGGCAASYLPFGLVSPGAAIGGGYGFWQALRDGPEAAN